MNHKIVLLAHKVLPSFLLGALSDYRNKQQLTKWQNAGKPLPPPHIVKQKTILEFKQKFGIDILVETGTYRGAMIAAQAQNFKQIYSIEIDKSLHAAAQERFRDSTHINLIHGDSGTQLKNIVNELQKPAIFWLDGHYSGGVTGKSDIETPINAELETVLNSAQKHIVIIDDARDFNGQKDYPTLETVAQFVKNGYPNLVFENKYDLIRIYPKN